MGEWRLVTLGDVTVNYDARRVPVRSVDRKNGPYPYYGASGIVDHVDDFLFEGDYLLIAEDGENLRTRNTPIAFMATGRFWVNNHAHIVQGNNLANTRYLCYFLSQTNVSGYLSGSTQPKLTQAAMNRIALRLPERRQQDAIVAVLGALDDKIAVNERIVSVTDNLLTALLGDILADDVDTVDVPLAEIAFVNVRTVRPTNGGYLRYIDISSVSPGRFDWPERIPWVDAPGRARRGVSFGDTVWSTVRPGRRSHALILDDDPELVASTGLAVLTPTEVGPAFFYEVTGRDEFVHYLESVAEGSAYPAVRAERFNQALVPIPSKPRLTCFEEQAMALRKRAHAASHESRKLAELRDTLLPKLMSGELRVREAEGIVGGVL